MGNPSVHPMVGGWMAPPEAQPPQEKRGGTKGCAKTPGTCSDVPPAKSDAIEQHPGEGAQGQQPLVYANDRSENELPPPYPNTPMEEAWNENEYWSENDMWEYWKVTLEGRMDKTYAIMGQLM